MHGIHINLPSFSSSTVSSLDVIGTHFLVRVVKKGFTFMNLDQPLFEGPGVGLVSLYT